jgi:hypothetical protein
VRSGEWWGEISCAHGAHGEFVTETARAGLLVQAAGRVHVPVKSNLPHAVIRTPAPAEGDEVYRIRRGERKSTEKSCRPLFNIIDTPVWILSDWPFFFLFLLFFFLFPE